NNNAAKKLSTPFEPLRRMASSGSFDRDLDDARFQANKRSASVVRTSSQEKMPPPSLLLARGTRSVVP
ncbi:unnamed protein product, partial [Amoebophrya sp. A25]